MRKLTAIAVAVSALGLGGQAYAAGNTANAQAGVGVTMIVPIAITKTADLRFGQFVQPPSYGEILIPQGGGTPDLSQMPAGYATIVQLGAGRGRALFDVAGQVGATYTVALPASVTLTRVGGTETMNVTGIGRTGSSGVQTFGSTGTMQYGVGGKLEVSVGGPQAVGAYTGTITMTVTYQ
jgi:hypothetical protein